MNPTLQTGASGRTIVVSYSHTGNNNALARRLAAALGAEHRRVTERRRRTMMTIILDTIFGRTPSVQVDLDGVDRDDLVILVGPVWMGHPAAPLRACFASLRERMGRYAFLTICGGADGPNAGLQEKLAARIGREPEFVTELLIADLLPPEPKPERRDTMAYRLSPAEVAALTECAVDSMTSHVCYGGGK